MIRHHPSYFVNHLCVMCMQQQSVIKQRYSIVLSYKYVLLMFYYFAARKPVRYLHTIQTKKETDLPSHNGFLLKHTIASQLLSQS